MSKGLAIIFFIFSLTLFISTPFREYSYMLHRSVGVFSILLIWLGSILWREDYSSLIIWEDIMRRTIIVEFSYSLKESDTFEKISNIENVIQGVVNLINNEEKVKGVSMKHSNTYFSTANKARSLVYEIIVETKK